ncbi:DUF2334 domain-containing protein [Fusibacter sp. Q10-2]|uniref:DUF2334 domain-containing protein n=2 Tax=Fusibacter ferrireducens TaxID=2785058 RepID=A0ABR9ZQJ1_9FIRM|nr:DUF2334 domain-containing protein [Fusibacter ferrireducens]
MSKCFRLSIGVLIIGFMLGILMSLSYAEGKLEKKVLILYEERYFYGDTRDTVTAMENLLGHYQTQVVEHKISDLKSYNFEAYDFVFILALDQEIESPRFYEALAQYEGELIWLGKSVEPLIKLKKYPLMYEGEVYDLLSIRYSKALTGDEKTFSIGTKRAFYKVRSMSPENRVYAWLSDGTDEFPFIVHTGNLYYISRVDINEPLFYIFSDFLNQLFYEKHYQENHFLISIEDVHVFSDYEQLKALTDVLYKNKVPFTIGLIPFVQQEGVDYITDFTEVSAFIDVLNYMQGHGGSIVLHTYVHEMKDDTLTISKLEARDIKQYFDRAISECLQNGLVPIGYEAPHAFLSKEEYDALKSIFTTAFGQIAITENNYIIYPYELYDTVNFNKLYPLNLGYIDPSDKDAFKIIDERLKRIELVNGFFAGIYYHSSVETFYLESLIARLKSEGIMSYDPLQDQHAITSRDFEVNIDNGRIDINSYIETVPKSPLSLFIDRLALVFSYVLFAIFIAFVVILTRSIRKQRRNLFK